MTILITTVVVSILITTIISTTLITTITASTIITMVLGMDALGVKGVRGTPQFNSARLQP